MKKNVGGSVDACASVLNPVKNIQKTGKNRTTAAAHPSRNIQGRNGPRRFGVASGTGPARVLW